MALHTSEVPVITRFGVSWPLLVGAVAFLGSLAVGHRLLSDPDTYWHITVGQWMLAQRAIPTQDPFSHTMPGAPWTSHEWLAEVLLALAYLGAGWRGVVTLTAAAHAVALTLVTQFLVRRLAPRHALLLVTLAWGLGAPHLLARPHILAMPLLVLWVAQLVKRCEAHRAPPFWLLGVLVAWANLHGVFSLALSLLLVPARSGRRKWSDPTG